MEIPSIDQKASVNEQKTCPISENDQVKEKNPHSSAKAICEQSPTSKIFDSKDKAVTLKPVMLFGVNIAESKPATDLNDPSDRSLA